MRDNLPPDQVAALLRASAKGFYSSEAATELLIRHDRWLRRRDFLANCVEVGHDEGTTWAWVEWDRVTGFLEDVACSSSEARTLQLAAELAGDDISIPLAELLTGLDDRNSRLVLAAVAHALHAGPVVSWEDASNEGADRPEIPRLARRVRHALADLSEGLGLANTYDDRTLDAVNVVYELAHHAADDEIHRGYRERAVCRYCRASDQGVV